MATATRLDTQERAPALSADELALAYRIACRSRSAEERIVRLVNQGKVKFAIWGPGEEIHGVASALAFKKACDPEHFGFVGHYRSGALITMWCALNGVDDYTLSVLRQQFSRATDPFSAGRNMVNHTHVPGIGVLPVQSPVGMQMGKAAGYAMGFKARGVRDAVVAAVIGDGSTAEGDMHDAMNAASVWSLPFVGIVTDNRVAISTRPEEGRGIRDFRRYAEAFGLDFYECDGRDFDDVYQTTWRCAATARREQRGALIHVHDMPRLNGHSSAGDYRFDLAQPDPLLSFGEDLVRRGVLEQADIVVRKPGSGADYFAHHELGAIMGEEDQRVAAWQRLAESEPEPDPATLHEFVRPPFPEVVEPDDLATRRETCVTYAGAIRAAHRQILTEKTAIAWGEDIGRLGGVMQATAGLKDLFPDRVLDSPLNEPLIVGTAFGAGLHPGTTAIAEIQFGDYCLNAYHWFVYMGNVYWSTLGEVKSSVIVRMPTDPFGGGAIYHSMSVDGYLSPIPGLVICMPSTSYDAYGLLVSAARYGGPVVFLEPKYCYRRTNGPAFPDEPEDEAGRRDLQARIRRGEIPEVGAGVAVPLGKGIVRRPGEDLTIVAWGKAALGALEAAEALAGEGISAEVIDLRTVVPPDMDLVRRSAARTGRVLIAHEDRSFGGFGRQIQGDLVEWEPALATRVVGMVDVPAIGQSAVLEEAAALSTGRIAAAARDLARARSGAGAPGGWVWIPPRYLAG